jgi:hypothetical protein
VKHNHPKKFLIGIALILLLATGTAVLAQTSAQFDLRWHVIGSGGGESGSARYRVSGTIGQSVASPPLSGSGGFTVSSGYWFVDRSATVYLPMVRKN